MKETQMYKCKNMNVRNLDASSGILDKILKQDAY